MSSSDGPPGSFGEAAAGLDRPTYENLRRALETGRWPDGRKLDDRQRSICIEAVVSWEAANLPPEQRTGYVERSACASAEPGSDRIRILDDD